MTQLVELQAATPKFAEAGIEVYAISYDHLGALQDFAEHHDITYELLSDRGSKVIREFGILNHHIPEEQVPFYGIPFPGTYLVDEDGVVVAKAFHQSIAQRESAEGLIDAALGEILLRSEEPTTALADDSGIGFSLTYHGGAGVIRGGTMRNLVISVDLPDGLHIYDDPVPTGMVATSFTLVGPTGLRNAPVRKPPTEPLDLPGVGSLQVWSGRVEFVIPVWATDEIASLLRDDNPDSVTIELDIAYQACDDQACRLPQTKRLTLEVPVGAYVAPELPNTGMGGGEKTTMDSQKWIREMVIHDLANTPDRDAAIAYLERARADSITAQDSSD